MILLLSRPLQAQLSRPALLEEEQQDDREQQLPETLREDAEIDLAGIEIHLRHVGWKVLRKSALATFPQGLREALEAEGPESVRPGVNLHPLLSISVLHFEQPKSIPGGNGAAFQRYGSAQAAEHFRGLVEDASAWHTTHLEAMRTGKQAVVIAAAGYLYEPATKTMADELQALVRAGPPQAQRDFSANRGKRRALRRRVSEAQKLLHYMGFYKGELDDLWGPQSRAAMEAFQVMRALPATGEPDSSSVVALRAEITRY